MTGDQNEVVLAAIENFEHPAVAPHFLDLGILRESKKNAN